MANPGEFHSHTSPAGNFWNFSLAVYARPGVEAACLDLQDRFGADVNVALYCLWIGRPLTGAAFDLVLEAAAPIRQFIEPLRLMRRSLPRDDGARERQKQAELAAEKLEQDALEALGAPGPANRQSARDNLGSYGRRLGADDKAFLQAAEALLAALD